MVARNGKTDSASSTSRAPRTRRGRKAGSDLSLEPSKRKIVKCDPLTEVPEPPEHLDEIAKGYWNRLAAQLVKANLLTQMHIETFAILCETYSEYRKYHDWLNADPSRATIVSGNGSECEAPQVRIRDRALASLNRMWMKFGLTPHALAGMRKHGGVGSGGSKLPPAVAFAKSKYADGDE